MDGHNDTLPRLGGRWIVEVQELIAKDVRTRSKLEYLRGAGSRDNRGPQIVYNFEGFNSTQ
jgi:hypothetical protein